MKNNIYFNSCNSTRVIPNNIFLFLLVFITSSCNISKDALCRLYQQVEGRQFYEVEYLYKKVQKHKGNKKIEPYVPILDYIEGRLKFRNTDSLESLTQEDLENIISKLKNLKWEKEKFQQDDCFKSFSKDKIDTLLSAYKEQLELIKPDLTRQDTLQEIPRPIIPSGPKPETQPVYTHEFKHTGIFNSDNVIRISYGNADQATAEVVCFDEGQYFSKFSSDFLKFVVARLEAYLSTEKDINLNDIVINITGTADRIPIVSAIPFIGFENRSPASLTLPSYTSINSMSNIPKQMKGFNIKLKDIITKNDTLALLRACEARYWLLKINAFKASNFNIFSKTYPREGQEYRKVIIEINIKNARKLQLEDYINKYKSAPGATNVKVSEPERSTNATNKSDIAIVIGVNAPKVQYGEEDAMDFLSFLQKENAKGRDIEWKLYSFTYKSKTTKENIEKKINEIKKENPDIGKIYFFYSGPSIEKSDGEIYLQLNASTTSSDRESDVSYTNVVKSILDLAGEEVFFFIDGHLDSNPLAASPPFSLRKILKNNNLHPKKIISLLGANAQGLPSFEGTLASEIENGLYTHHLLQGMVKDEPDNADGWNKHKKKNGFIELGELEQYLLLKLDEDSKQLYGRRQSRLFEFYSANNY